MSIFSFPRFHVRGLFSINVGTANNDDYSGVQFPPGWGEYTGSPLRLSDSDQVEALTYGMDDATFIEWVQQAHPFVQPPKATLAVATAQNPVAPALTRAERPLHNAEVTDDNTVNYIPGEWNYYGDMGVGMIGMNVINVQDPDGLVKQELTGAELSFKVVPQAKAGTGMLIDVNAEDVPCSQVFADALTLVSGQTTIFSGPPSKSATRWINFQRNINLNGPNGASACFQSTVPLSAIQGQPIVSWLPPTDANGKSLAGIVFRYYMYRPLQTINTFKYDNEEWLAQMQALYKKENYAEKLNPDYVLVTGTIAPWYEGEMVSAPTGRLLNPTANTFPLPAGSLGNAQPDDNGIKHFGLAPAVLTVDWSRNVVSVDFSGTFPDNYQNPDYNPLQTDTQYNPKYDFGQVNLVLRSGELRHDFGPVNYADTEGGDAIGWIFDFPIDDSSGTLKQMIESGDFALTSPDYGDLLAESEYYIVSDQSCIFGEQGGAGSTEDSFTNDGPTDEPATVRIFRKGVELGPDQSPEMTLWEYDTTPNQSTGPREKLSTTFKAGDPLSVSVEKSGNRLYTFTLPGQADPPVSYKDLNLMVVPMINLRILPNFDYSRYYVDPTAPEPVGNDSLNFDVIYNEIFRNYYLLYPGMNARRPLNNPEYWVGAYNAQVLLERTSRETWPHYEYMPRTRDLSETRRTLLQAWARKTLGM